MEQLPPYQPQHKIRFVTAASLFDGHDATINIIRRILQASGAEVIHLGHNRSVDELVNCAIQEDVQGIALTSYQGGHMEYFTYMYDELHKRGADHIKIFGGGGGVILPHEIDELMSYGIARIYSPDDGRKMGLQGMINDMLQQCDFETPVQGDQAIKGLKTKKTTAIASLITLAENHPDSFESLNQRLPQSVKNPVVLGITGTGGAGKSTLVDELVRRFLSETNINIAIISVDPSKRKTGGALLGDRIRMNAINDKRVYMRSLATRQANTAVSKYIQEAIAVCKAAQYELVIVETSGIGQSDTMITDYSNVSLYVMTPEFGAATQLEKIDMLDFADIIAINKADKRGAADALRDVRKQYKRNHQLFDKAGDTLPVYTTIASQFNDAGMNGLYDSLLRVIHQKTGINIQSSNQLINHAPDQAIIPPDRVRYLAEIVENNTDYNEWVGEQCAIAQQLFQLDGTLKLLEPGSAEVKTITALQQQLESKLHPDCKKLLEHWPEMVKQYHADDFIYHVRNKAIRQSLVSISLSQLRIPKIALPKYTAWGDLLRWLLTENVPGQFPYTAGVFPLKREGEDPTRMFAGEGNPERTNKRFHYVSSGQPAHRLSTAFDSVTLYGEDPDMRPDIYGKIGNAGVSIATLDDAKKLYSGFDLCDPSTSVSMTINGPAPMLLGFFMNAAIDQQCEKYIMEHQLQHLVEAKFKELYDDRGVKRPEYHKPHPISLSKGEGDELSSKQLYANKPHPISLSKGEGLNLVNDEKLHGEPHPKSLSKGEGLDLVNGEKPHGEPHPTSLSKGEGLDQDNDISIREGLTAFGYETSDAKNWESLKANSQSNRQKPTEAEEIIWQFVRNGQTGFKIRRQHAIDNYIADFVCLPKGLVIEIDGDYHQFTKEQDELRGRALKMYGFDVIRFTNDEVLNDTDTVINTIKRILKNQSDRKIIDINKDKALSFGEGLGEVTHNGLGLMLLGLSGDQVLPPDIYARIKSDTLKAVRGTVQADILKEDQAQNTCIFSTEFALRMMGDMQQYFIDQQIKNFYSVSVSGYHIAEAGANPITQLAFTLSNGFTYVEYYLSRGMHIDDFAPNLSFFFSNGIDPEYAVIGRVARRIWAKAIKNKYKGSERSQKLKYHIQTSGRSLHAQEIDFNDIRTTLQALYAIYDNCNSLHTNAYDEAITTPTEESVRRAMAIQLIINRELGLAKNENPLQGAFIIEELTDLVEEAVMAEFKRINDRGGMLGAMETMYQRSKIQEESLYYETLKHTGEYPIVGVNTFLNKKGSPTILPAEVIRATGEEKQLQITALKDFKARNQANSTALLKDLQQAAINNKNIFENLMEACKYCSLGELTHALYGAGGQYRRNM